MPMGNIAARCNFKDGRCPKGRTGKEWTGTKIRMPTFEILDVVICFFENKKDRREERAERDRFGSLYQDAYKCFSLESK